MHEGLFDRLGRNRTVSTSGAGGTFKVVGGWEGRPARRNWRRPNGVPECHSATLWSGYYSRRRPPIRDRPERVGNDVENVDHPWLSLP